MSETVHKKMCQNPTCEESDLQREDGLLVCVNCGQVHNKGGQQLADDPTQGLTVNCRDDDVKSYVVHNKNFPNRFPVGKRVNMEDVQRLIANLSLEAEVKNAAEYKFRTMIEGHFRCYCKANKRVLAGVCVYISLINDQCPVTVGHICNTVGCSNSDFFKIFNQVYKEYPEFRCEQSLVPIESLIPVTLTETTIDVNEKKIIIEKVRQIIELERECWMIEGRTPVHIIFAAAFLAWKSVQPYDRRKVKLTDFCRKVGIEYKHTTSQRVTELFNAIKTLATNAPDLRGREITKNNIGIYLDKILEYKSSLVYDFNEKIKRCNGSKSVTDKSDGTHNMFSFFKRKFKEKDESSADRRPCDGDQEIDDSEIDGYIRNRKEVKIYKKLKSIAKAREDETDSEGDL